MAWIKYPRSEKEKQGCLTEMQRMYELRKKYKEELKDEETKKAEILR